MSYEKNTLKICRFSPNPSHLPQIEDLITELTGKKIRCRLVNSPDAFSFGVFLEGKLVGMLSFFVLRLHTGNVGRIADVVVLKEFRHKGYGTKLVETALRFAKSRKVLYVDVCPRSFRTEAQETYKNCGFVLQKDLYVFRKKLA